MIEEKQSKKLDFEETVQLQNQLYRYFIGSVQPQNNIIRYLQKNVSWALQVKKDIQIWDYFVY